MEEEEGEGEGSPRGCSQSYSVVAAGPAKSFQVKKKGDFVLSRDGWQIRIKLLPEQQDDIRETSLIYFFLIYFFSP